MIIIHVVEPFAAGIAVFVRSLVENMPDDLHIIVHGERAEVTKLKDIKKEFSRSNVRFIRWHSAQRSLHPGKDFSAAMELYTILRRLRKKNLLDAVHLHSSKSGFIGRVVCRLLKIDNVVYTPNGAPFLVGNTQLSNYMYKQLERIGSLFGGQVVCCSPSEQGAYEDAGIRAITINNGITNADHSSLFVTPEKSRFRIVTSGRVQRQKNPRLFNSIAEYFKDLDQFEFVWIGSGPDTALLKSDNIKITGWLPPAEVVKLVQSADIYLSTSKFEGLSFSVLEALALKKPVLLSDCVGNRDMVKSGLNGDLFENPQQAIIKILQYYNNQHMLTIMGKHSASHCEDVFDVLDMQQQYKELYLSGKNAAIA
jgi:glycosyltransferase involved in cell wall biosynthesis